MVPKQNSNSYIHLKKRYGNMKTFFEGAGYEAILNLTPKEKEFAYNMSMVAICSYPITLFQLCPHPEVLHKIANCLINNPNDNSIVHSDLRTYWLYLFANYGCHCVNETKLNKKVPSDLGLNLTPKMFKELGIELSSTEELYIFDKSYFPTSTVLESIEKSGSHFYGHDMTTKLYNDLPIKEKNKLNGYYDLENGVVKSHLYSSIDTCADYISNCIYWLVKARLVAVDNPKFFDSHTANALEYLIRYYRTGNEKDFKDHCKEWLQMRNPKVEFCIGFIELYDDPMSKIGTHQADVTIKSLDINGLLKILPSFEEKFPFPREWKRSDMSIIPNASTAYKIMGLGGLGPVLSTIAYCLPNYYEMRSKFGSKQIMYTLPKSRESNLYKQIYLSKSEREIYDTYSPDMKLSEVIESLCTILHETIGHASGSNVNGLDTQTKNNQLGKYTTSLEECRAEIIALYVGTYFLSDIASTGILGNFNKIPRAILLELQVLYIAGAAIPRWYDTPINSTEVSQAHAIANTAIMYYLLDNCKGAMELVEENIKVDNKDPRGLRLQENLTVLKLVIHDVYKLLPLIELMAYEVQELSSTANFNLVDKFMKKYGLSTRNLQYSRIVKAMSDMYSEGVIENIQIFPEWSEKNTGELEVKVPLDSIDSTLLIWRLATKNF
jgi:hypothetical protein